MKPANIGIPNKISFKIGYDGTPATYMIKANYGGKY